MANTGDLHGKEPWESKSEEDEDKREVECSHERRKCLRKAILVLRIEKFNLAVIRDIPDLFQARAPDHSLPSNTPVEQYKTGLHVLQRRHQFLRSLS